MKTNLDNAIINLYNEFSIYTIEGNLKNRCCDCCVNNEEIKSLLSIPLRKLSYDNLYHFMTSAITTFGDERDYKHFLPRILELMVNNHETIDDFLTFEKLNYSNWQNWNENEVSVIKTYFKVLLKYALEYNLENINDCILINMKYNEFNEFSNILLETNSEKFLQRIVKDTLNLHKTEIDDRLQNLYSDKRILDKMQRLFFKTKDKTEANRISIAYSILERND